MLSLKQVCVISLFFSLIIYYAKYLICCKTWIHHYCLKFYFLNQNWIQMLNRSCKYFVKGRNRSNSLHSISEVDETESICFMIYLSKFFLVGKSIKREIKNPNEKPNFLRHPNIWEPFTKIDVWHTLC